MTGFARREGASPARYRARVGTALLALLLLITALWNNTHAGGAYDDRSSIPTAVDHFLGAVRALTPPGARLLVVDTWQDNVVYVRALYMLAPRRQSLLPIPPADMKSGLLHFSWPELRRRAHRQHARYIVFYTVPFARRRTPLYGWLLPALRPGLIPATAVRLRDGPGTLVDVTP